MNNLAYRTSEENGLSFELVVDGQSLASLIGSRDAEIPYWIIDDDLPYFPPFGEEEINRYGSSPFVLVVNTVAAVLYAGCSVSTVLLCSVSSTLMSAGRDARPSFVSQPRTTIK